MLYQLQAILHPVLCGEISGGKLKGVPSPHNVHPHLIVVAFFNKNVWPLDLRLRLQPAGGWLLMPPRSLLKMRCVLKGLFALDFRPAWEMRCLFNIASSRSSGNVPEREALPHISFGK
eukprot:scaffold541_cov138-Cylindrotheca_fusiformis.AAC.3